MSPVAQPYTTTTTSLSVSQRSIPHKEGYVQSRKQILGFKRVPQDRPTTTFTFATTTFTFATTTTTTATTFATTTTTTTTIVLLHNYYYYYYY
ncbi:hypothetical protein M0802_013510 [Mischocyttarus mexicanus]|nr:hypothetical protein M0802_013510 [Mischocyttarus mexicanus]